MTKHKSYAWNPTNSAGIEYVVACQAGEVLLDCTLDTDLDPVYQCQDGQCGSRMVAMISGKVKMRKNNELSRRDLDKG
ncbi:MAG: 2Fe-2S iron-sulfur cluster binding domain-containing protein [Proteobacteria bacterium]|nr:2Fe-2S iron-sulfur cluster binding domain-containing protein [Pseudomonadota bacterium]